MLNLQKAEAFPRIQPRNHDSRRMNRANHLDELDQREMGIELNAARMEAINIVLDFYERCEDCRNACQLMKIMDQEFADKSGKKHLYNLLPAGPLSSIHKLADLPNLGHQVNKCFGTSY